MGSQQMKLNKDVQKLVDLGRNHIIDLALKKREIKVPKEDFHYIEVIATYDHIRVTLGYNLEYHPLNNCNEIEIQLLGYGGRYSGDCENLIGFENTIKPKRKAIDFVLKALDPKHYTNSMDLIKNSGDKITIKEQRKNYEVTFASRERKFGGSYSIYTVKKRKGIITNDLSGHYEINPSITFTKNGYKIKERKHVLNADSEAVETPETERKWIYYYYIRE